MKKNYSSKLFAGILLKKFSKKNYFVLLEGVIGSKCRCNFNYSDSSVHDILKDKRLGLSNVFMVKKSRINEISIYPAYYLLFIFINL